MYTCHTVGAHWTVASAVSAVAVSDAADIDSRMDGESDLDGNPTC